MIGFERHSFYFAFLFNLFFYVCLVQLLGTGKDFGKERFGRVKVLG